jgi:sirohydrochlorin ferrochelatase
VEGCLDGTGAQRVILVDHGSPRPEVTEVRDRLTRLLAQRLAGRVAGVSAASMERRPEPEYDFNEPLLERALRALPEGRCEVVLAMLFVSPGRHAGPGGDIVQICEAACAERPGLSVRMTPLVGEHPGLISLLVRRLGCLGEV